MLHEFYAATETLIITNITAEEMRRKPRSVGRPAWDVFLRLLDERGAEVPVGQVGEIYLQGPSLFSGYYRDSQKTDEAFRDGWFTLGDLGKLDEDGYLYIVDRRTDMVISGGRTSTPARWRRCCSGTPRWPRRR